MKGKLGFGFWFLGFIAICTAKSCPGFCTKDLEKCTANNGKIVGYCQNEMACCDVVAGATGTCGSTFKRLNVTYFKSPNFPQKSSGDLICEFKLKLSEESIGIRIDFLQFQFDGVAYGQGKTCDSDMFFIRGFQTWSPPPRCGVLTGYSTIIDREGVQAQELKTLSLLALMSSPTYLWHVKITQLYQRETDDLKNQSPVSRTNLSTIDELNLMESPPQSSGAKIDEKFSAPSIDAKNEDNSEFWTKRNLNVNPRSIINGVDTDIKEVPWQASLRLLFTTAQASLEAIQEATGANCNVTEGIHFCGGSIVGNQHILSAAHCFFASSKTQSMTDLSLLKVILGDTNRCRDDPSSRTNSTQYDVEGVTFHYAYDGNIIDNDIAIVKLKQKIKFKENVKAIRLADNDTEYTGQLALVSGWGFTELGEDSAKGMPELLQSSREFTIENETLCHQALAENLGGTEDEVKGHDKYEHVYAGVFCTGSKLKTKQVKTGQGDSGGSLVVLHNNGSGDGEYLQLGIVSYALTNTTAAILASGETQLGNNVTTCPQDDELDYFQSVPHHRPWIDLALHA